MKTPFQHLAAVAVLGLLACHPSALFAQASTSTTTVVSSNGTVSDFKPNNIALKVGRTEEATNYTVTKTTTFTDESGNPVSMETVQSGAPVTVYYEKQGPDIVAHRVIVHHSISTTAPAATATETTVTTTPPTAVAPAAAVATTTTTTSAAPDLTPPSASGVVTDLGDSHIDVRTSSSPHPIHYRSHDSTAFVDESGNPVDRDHVSLGSPVTVFFEQSDDGLTATRVILRNPAVLDR